MCGHELSFHFYILRFAESRGMWHMPHARVEWESGHRQSYAFMSTGGGYEPIFPSPPSLLAHSRRLLFEYRVYDVLRTRLLPGIYFGDLLNGGDRTERKRWKKHFIFVVSKYAKEWDIRHDHGHRTGMRGSGANALCSPKRKSTTFWRIWSRNKREIEMAGGNDLYNSAKMWKNRRMRRKKIWNIHRMCLSSSVMECKGQGIISRGKNRLFIFPLDFDEAEAAAAQSKQTKKLEEKTIPPSTSFESCGYFFFVCSSSSRWFIHSRSICVLLFLSA